MSAVEPDIGDEAPSLAGQEETDAEQAEDDVEFPEAVVLVGKTQWRCVTCMVIHPRTVSIDEHLNTVHRLQEVLPMTPLEPKATKRGRGRGQGAVQVKVTPQSSSKAEPESKHLRLSHPLSEESERGKSAQDKGKGNLAIGKAKLKRGRGRGRQRSRGRGRGGRGRGKVLKPLTNEDSDTEIEEIVASPLHDPLPQMRQQEKSVADDGDEKARPGESGETIVEETQNKENIALSSSPSPSKKSRTEDFTAFEEPAIDNVPSQCSSVPVTTLAETLKELMKEKYVVFVEKAGTWDSLSECEAHIDNEPPLAIEIPSLQADTLLPPVTPLLPEIHGPPETPLPPNTPHLPEVHHLSDPLHPPDPSELDCQFPNHPPAPHIIVSALATEQLSQAEDSVVLNPSVVAVGSSLNRSSDVNDKDSALSLVCRTCGVSFDSLEELRTHREEMVKFDVVSCNSCGDKFHGLHQLNIHVFTVHEKFAKKFCFLCDAYCLDGYELEEHLLEHTSVDTDKEDDASDSIQHTCKICGILIEGNLSDLMNHYHTIHDQLICTECNELFTDLTEYEDHRMLHSAQVVGQGDVVVYSCPVSDCFQICANREALMDHISWHEDRDMEDEQLSLLHCHHCGSPFRNTVSLQRHLAETHSEPDLRPFVCELCGADYSHSLELHQHNTIHHAGIKRYGCAYCDKRFAFRSAHRRHVASEHDVAATLLRM